MISERDTSSNAEPLDSSDDPPPPENLEALAMKHTVWLMGGGIVAGLVIVVVALLFLRDTTNNAEFVPVILGAFFTFLGAVLGHLQGAASGRADAARARKEADALRNLIRLNESENATAPDPAPDTRE